MTPIAAVSSGLTQSVSIARTHVVPDGTSLADAPTSLAPGAAEV